MKRTGLVAIFLFAFIGCKSTELRPPADHLIVRIDRAGVATVDGRLATSHDWPELVKQRHITSAELWANESKPEDVRRIQDELRAAGATDVVVTQPGHADWYDRQQQRTAASGSAVNK